MAYFLLEKEKMFRIHSSLNLGKEFKYYQTSILSKGNFVKTKNKEKES